MRESHVEGVATHGDPESYTDAREGGGEALTGARAGRVLSREMHFRDADAVILRGRQHRQRRYRETSPSPARSKTPCTYGTYLRENREICGPLGAFSLRAASGKP
jgi:RNA-directed DNA polymerase